MYFWELRQRVRKVFDSCSSVCIGPKPFPSVLMGFQKRLAFRRKAKGGRSDSRADQVFAPQCTSRGPHRGFATYVAPIPSRRAGVCLHSVQDFQAVDGLSVIHLSQVVQDLSSFFTRGVDTRGMLQMCSL